MRWTGRKSASVSRAPVHATAAETWWCVPDELVAGYERHRVRVARVIRKAGSYDPPTCTTA
jgi:hypothetical protein